MNTAERTEKLVEAWKEILKPNRYWILFEKGTCFVSTDIESDVKKIAVEVLKEWGPVVPGTSLGDFTVSMYQDSNDELLGWLVNYGHPDLMTFVLIDEVEDLHEFSESENISKEEAAKTYPDMVIGMFARQRREEDSRELKMVYIGYPE